MQTNGKKKKDAAVISVAGGVWLHQLLRKEIVTPDRSLILYAEYMYYLNH